MSPKAQNEAIGRSLGWKSCGECGNILCDLWVPPGKTHYRDAVHLPDYVNDLDATRSAVLLQPQDFQQDFHDTLLGLNGLLHQATSTQWAEIFIDIALRKGIIKK